MKRKTLDELKPFRKLELLLRGHGYNANNLSIFLPYCRNTVQERMEHPGSFRLDDLADIVRDGEITFDQIVEAIRGDFE